MKLKGLLVFAVLACTLAASAALRNVTTIPGTQVAFEVDAKVEEKGQALKDLEEEARLVLEDAKEYSFETKSGVFGSLMAYTPKDEFKSMSGEWTGMIAEGIEEAIEGPAKITRHEVGTFGSRKAHFLTMTLKEATVETSTEFIVIGGKGEVILLAMTADLKDATACAELGKIVKSVTYEGTLASGLKEKAKVIDSQR